MIKHLTHPKHWQRICDWVNDGLPYNATINSIDGAVGVEKDGELIGGTTLVNSNGVNCYAQIRLLNTRSLTKTLIEKTFYHAFVTLGLKRVSNTIIGENIPSIRFTQKMGFELEGVLKGINPDGSNVYLSVMRPDICKYLEV